MAPSSFEASPLLARAWREAGGAGSPGAAAPDEDPALETALAAAVATGRERWPALALAPEVFVAHLARAAAPYEPQRIAALGSLHVADLYLACACAAGVPGAVDAFEETHLRALGAAVAGAVSLRADEVDELRQILRVKLLVSEAPSAPPLITAYSGRGPLAAWVRVAAVRQALTRARDAQVGARAGRRAVAEGALGGAAVDVELHFIKGRYRREFEEAFAAALADIDDRERALLRMSAVAGLTLEKIGAIYHVDRSTVSRWLADARRGLLDRTEANLRARLGVQPAEFQSMARLLTSQLEIDLPELLRTVHD